MSKRIDALTGYLINNDIIIIRKWKEQKLKRK